MRKRYCNMKKKATGNAKIREINEGKVFLPIELPLPMADVIENIPEMIRELSQETGLLLMSAAMQSECERIAGPKDSKNPQLACFIRNASSFTDKTLYVSMGIFSFFMLSYFNSVPGPSRR